MSYRTKPFNIQLCERETMKRDSKARVKRKYSQPPHRHVSHLILRNTYVSRAGNRYLAA